MFVENLQMTDDENIDIVDLLSGDDRHEYCSEAVNEIKRLRKQNEFLKTTIRSLDPEKFPGPFIHAFLGEKDWNGMPEKFLIVPALGVDFSYVYQKTGQTTGTEW
jgi:hypothetical protein